MKYVRFQYEEEIFYGQLEGDIIYLLDRPYLEEGFQKTGQIIHIDNVRLLAPVVPNKIVCIGLNYAKHIEELGHTLHDEPVIFLKPPTAVIGPGDEIVIPAMSQQVEYEAELVVVMGKTAKDISEEQAEDYIFGYTCGNDVTARDLQKKDGQWTRCKGFDTFCPIGPWIVKNLDYDNVDICSILNGEVKQSSNTRNFINSVPKLVSYISQIMTLHAGDLIMTGTPEGVGPMKTGEVIVVEIQGIGQLQNKVR